MDNYNYDIYFNKNYHDDVYNNAVDDTVTHWMPLPEPPKEE